MADTSATQIAVLMNDTASAGFQAEHGLAVWIWHAGSRILFDTGQTEALLQNAQKLGIDISSTDAVVLSHGHYDHTGGLAAVLAQAPQAAVFLHPAALSPKFSRKSDGVKSIGIPQAAQGVLKGRRIIWTTQPVSPAPKIFLTGPVPSTHPFEDVGGDFYQDPDCQIPDGLPDDQALWLETEKGLLVVVGCAHAGLVNTLDLISRLTGGRPIHTLLGGFHLLNASFDRIEKTIQALRRYRIRQIAPLHCTGSEALRCLRDAFPEAWLPLAAGSRLAL
jgi:7,8-dihydropterin-6-yl-methyl-4-(beta-D-ribofuranosyl)aminobenzene 5'-phosphate synthase